MRSVLDAIYVLLLASAPAWVPGRSVAQEPDAPAPQAGVEGRLLLAPEVRTDRLWVRIRDSHRPGSGNRRDKALARVAVDRDGRFEAHELRLGAVDLLLETTGDYRFLALREFVQPPEGATLRLADIDLRGRVACCVLRMQTPAGDAIPAATLHAASQPRSFTPFLVPCEEGTAVVTIAGSRPLRYWADAPGFQGRWIEKLSSDLTLTLEPVPVLRLRLGRRLRGANDTRIRLTPFGDPRRRGAAAAGVLEGCIGREDSIEVEVEREGFYRIEIEQLDPHRRPTSYSLAPPGFRPVPNALPRVFELRGPVTEVEIDRGPSVPVAGPEGETAGVEGRLILDPGVPTEHLRLWMALAGKSDRPVTRRIPPLALVAIDAAGRFRAPGLPGATVDLALDTPSDHRLHVLARRLGLWPGITIRIPDLDVRGRVHACRVHVQDPEGQRIPGATITHQSFGPRVDWSFDASKGPVDLVTTGDLGCFVADALGFGPETILFGQPELTVTLELAPVVRLLFDYEDFGHPKVWGLLGATLTNLEGPLQVIARPAAKSELEDPDLRLTFEVASEGHYRLNCCIFPFFMFFIPTDPSVIDVRGPLTEVRVSAVEAEHR